jgi:hypothetical protein
MPEPIFMKLGISTACFTNPSHESVSVCVSPLSLRGNGSVNKFPRQRIHATIELLDSFSMRSVSYQKKSEGLSVYPLPLLGNG